MSRSSLRCGWKRLLSMLLNMPCCLGLKTCQWPTVAFTGITCWHCSSSFKTIIPSWNPRVWSVHVKPAQFSAPLRATPPFVTPTPSFSPTRILPLLKQLRVLLPSNSGGYNVNPSPEGRFRVKLNHSFFFNSRTHYIFIPSWQNENDLRNWLYLLSWRFKSPFLTWFRPSWMWLQKVSQL